jgi:hypothetical protein
MLVRIIRSLTPEEVKHKIQNFEKKHGVSFDEFEESLLKRRLGHQLIGEYFEWADLVHAYRGYEESGELDYVIEEMRDLSLYELESLTPKRLLLLCSLANVRVESINELAKRTRRNVKNVYHDLQVLKKFGFVIFTKHGKRNIVPMTLVEEITFIVR